ncbi:RDD family protein [Macrococcoides caseolyticum]|uniref:RDD family protein n=1 Tax=Macrococcoides caseolyticum TaxID=69966 RepID=UPI00105B4968|nr:RDD family protein [Macrococcus caseolyticus]QQB06386.1 RDD family protein [Macrococcus caseolyticus]TDM31006.1 RDD family protein [Macrococcus caseolyticus]
MYEEKYEQHIESDLAVPVNSHNVNDKLIQQLIHATEAGFGIRFVAFIIDLIVIGSIKNIVLNPFDASYGLSDIYIMTPLFSVYNVLSALIYFGYFILLTYFFNATLGKIILKLKVVHEDGRKLSIGTVITREFFGRYISNFFAYLLYLVILFNPNKRGIHDLLSDTLVVKEESALLREKLVKQEIRI